MITEIEGIKVGHWTDSVAQTGCTVILFPEETIASGEIRGGAPATRDFALLEPTRTVEKINAVVLSGGSAFGLSACSGEWNFLKNRILDLARRQEKYLLLWDSRYLTLVMVLRWFGQGINREKKLQ